MDAIDSVADPLREFSNDSIRLVKRCRKPDRKEFTKVALRTAIESIVMGFVGFFVKLIFIPIDNIIVGIRRGSSAMVLARRPSSLVFVGECLEFQNNA